MIISSDVRKKKRPEPPMRHKHREHSSTQRAPRSTAQVTGSTMGAEKEISSAVALAGCVDTLRIGLTSFEVSAGQMTAIFQDFEGRLSKLESEMLPMKDISAKLTMARRNISSAIAKVFTVLHAAWCVLCAVSARLCCRTCSTSKMPEL